MIRTGFALLVLLLMLGASLVYYADSIDQAQLNQWLIVGSVAWFVGLFWIDWFQKKKSA
jgi:undecaprenyl pyrophosphate phosphatase UppP